MGNIDVNNTEIENIYIYIYIYIYIAYSIKDTSCDKKKNSSCGWEIHSHVQ